MAEAQHLYIRATASPQPPHRVKNTDTVVGTPNESGREHNAPWLRSPEQTATANFSLIRLLIL
jgi:hypothetical protein